LVVGIWSAKGTPQMEETNLWVGRSRPTQSRHPPPQTSSAKREEGRRRYEGRTRRNVK
jgi:hypothetical protein